MSAQPFLDMTAVSKRFGGVLALSNVDFSVRPGEIHCLVGENGSGKSTLIKIVCGVHAPEPGARIVIGGHQVGALTPAAAHGYGVQVIYQDLSLFPNLSVAENIGFAHHLDGAWRLAARGRLRQTARRAMDQIGIALDLDRPVGSLSIASRQLVAICRAIAAEARLVIMDEPTASLTRQEVDRLLAVLRDLNRRGICTVFISHRLDEVMEVADVITVLRDGAKVGTFPVAELTRDRLAHLMTGMEFAHRTQQGDFRDRPALLSVRGLSRAGDFEDISFDLHAGEILGITGLLGSGRTELALSLFGMNPPTAGTALLEGRALRLESNRDAIASGVAYVSEDRLTLGLIMQQSVAHNATITVLDKLTDRFGLINPKRRGATIRRWIDELRIRVVDAEAPVRTLSGGNQQRVVLAKWLATDPKVLILDAPTVGVDVAAKSGIYEIVNQLAARGVAVIMISDEIPEVYYHCHRVLVMRDGRLAGEFVPREVAEATLKDAVNA